MGERDSRLGGAPLGAKKEPREPASRTAVKLPSLAAVRRTVQIEPSDHQPYILNIII